MPPEYEEMHKEKLLSHLMDMTMSLRNLCSHQPAAFSREVVITLRMVEQKIPKPLMSIVAPLNLSTLNLHLRN